MGRRSGGEVGGRSPRPLLPKLLWWHLRQVPVTGAPESPCWGHDQPLPTEPALLPLGRAVPHTEAVSGPAGG